MAGLLLRAGQPVPTDHLISLVWGEAPPATATAQIHKCVSELRGALGQDRVVRGAGGYALDLQGSRSDCSEFERVVEAARTLLAADRPKEAAREFRAALALWRGAPLADGTDALRLSEAPALEELRIRVLLERIDVDLSIGHHREIVGELRGLVDQQPLFERLRGQLMLALYRSGRPAEALRVYREGRALLAEELGTDPDPSLTRLHDDMLHHRPHLATVAPGQELGTDSSEHHRADTRTPVVPRGIRPQQLPLTTTQFVGRTLEMSCLDALLEEEEGAPTPVAVAAVTGMAGVGKSTLALYWAHRIADRFPDGQLYLNLHGFDPNDVLPVEEALRRLLEALDVPYGGMPPGVEARAGLLRSLLAQRRMLIVLDNARDTEQVRSLLPGSGHCMVVVTSRNRLTDLVITHGARPFHLDVLTGEEARALLVRRVGADRVDTEPNAVDSILAVTGRLPMALAIVAARAAAHANSPLCDFVNGGDRLDALVDGDVRRVFSWSYQALGEEAARLFRLLALHPGPDLTAGAAAALVGVSNAAAVLPALHELTRLHLLVERVPGRYAFHDLLRDYAAELALHHETEEQMRAARHRLYDWYLRCSHPAALLVQPTWPGIDPAPPLSANPAAPPVDKDAATVWFTAERQALLGIVRQSAHDGFEIHAWQLAWALTAYLAPRGLWQQQRDVQEVALAAAELVDDHVGSAVTQRLLAGSYTRLGEVDRAEALLGRARDLYRKLDDATGQAHALYNLGEVCYLQGRLTEAITHGHEALRLYRTAGEREGEARTLNAVGWMYAMGGDFAEAVEYCSGALARQRVNGDLNGQAATLDSLGFIHHHLGHRDEAVRCYEEAIERFHDCNDRYHEAGTLARLGDSLQSLGDSTAAYTVWQQAVSIFDELGDATAEDVRRRLSEHSTGEADSSGAPVESSEAP